jgi:2,4-dienoyl-CoA reductase-like NADH-dependent reductase (Old Yellow Enzyme family)
MVRAGHADIIAIGRGALTHQDFPTRVASGKPLSEFDRDILSPVADLANQDLQKLQSRAA